ncbi:MAG: hypothetical protein NC923_00705 [Candidatus Omnitrophica bacterium]|nr:hypothetical protein [Candidatus Omnitrophota bacterium]
MKKICAILLIIIFFLVAILSVKDFIIRATVSTVVSKVIGAKATIGRLSLNLFNQSIVIANLKVYNPKGFSNTTLLDMPELSVRYDIASLLKGKLHLPFIEAQLKEISLEKNKDGRLNVDSLRVSHKKERGLKPSRRMQIDLLKLSIGRIVLKDFANKTHPEIKGYEINLKKSFKNIISVEQLALIILTEPMKEAAIRGTGIYAAAALTGAGFAPIITAVALSGKDSDQQELDFSIFKVYDTALQVLQRIGRIENENRQAGIIVSEVYGAKVIVRLTQISEKSTRITVSARKFAIPHPEIASGVLYQISGELK